MPHKVTPKSNRSCHAKAQVPKKDMLSYECSAGRQTLAQFGVWRLRGGQDLQGWIWSRDLAILDLHVLDSYPQICVLSSLLGFETWGFLLYCRESMFKPFIQPPTCTPETSALMARTACSVASNRTQAAWLPLYPSRVQLVSTNEELMPHYSSTSAG